MIEPKIGENVTIDGVTYECAEPQAGVGCTFKGGWMWKLCDLYHDSKNGCCNCKILCNAYYRKDGKHIILKRTSK